LDSIYGYDKSKQTRAKLLKFIERSSILDRNYFANDWHLDL